MKSFFQIISTNARAHARGLDSEKGATIFEAAICLSLGMTVIIACMDLLRFAYIDVAGQYALSAAAREISFGEVPNGGNRITHIKNLVINSAETFGVHFKADDIRICPIAKTDCTADEPEIGGNPYFVRASFPQQLWILGMKNFEHKFRIYAYNEPYNV